MGNIITSKPTDTITYDGKRYTFLRQWSEKETLDISFSDKKDMVVAILRDSSKYSENTINTVLNTAREKSGKKIYF